MMNNTILLLTHGLVGQAIMQAASNTLGENQTNVLSVSISDNQKRLDIINKLENIINEQPNNNFLILTDLYGSTPCNVASKLIKKNKVAVISGLNLGMLLKSINYINLPFSELIIKASEGGKECIKTCE